jgi:hypothetical protein
MNPAKVLDGWPSKGNGSAAIAVVRIQTSAASKWRDVLLVDCSLGLMQGENDLCPAHS